MLNKKSIGAKSSRGSAADAVTARSINSEAANLCMMLIHMRYVARSFLDGPAAIITLGHSIRRVQLSMAETGRPLKLASVSTERGLSTLDDRAGDFWRCFSLEYRSECGGGEIFLTRIDPMRSLPLE
jgi:hypothetical protein